MPAAGEGSCGSSMCAWIHLRHTWSPATAGEWLAAADGGSYTTAARFDSPTTNDGVISLTERTYAFYASTWI
jgi:hypothetical protein